MPHPIFGYMLLELLIGVIGMALASQKVDTPTQNQRWFKYATYILIVGTVLASIFLELFWVLGSVIIVVGVFEIGFALYTASNLSKQIKLLILMLYAFVSISFIGFASFSISFLLFVYFQVFTFDGFSQITGQLVGKHSLVPAISPNKTLEGFLGGLLFTLLAAALAHSWIQLSVFHALLFGLLTSTFSFIGDVLASYVKRLAGIKDYSQLLPGHGGLLDRFDSLLFTGASYYAFSLLVEIPQWGFFH